MAMELESKRVACVGLLGGRFDQEMNNLNVLQKYALKHSQVDFIAAGKESLLCVVKPQMRTVVRVGPEFAKRHTGVVCFGKARVQTKGLRWELGEGAAEELEWGRLVSSSNEIVGSEVAIMASHLVFLSLELENGHKSKEC